MSVGDRSEHQSAAVAKAREAQRRYNELQGQVDDEKNLRNRAIREAVDWGVTPKQLARAIGLSEARIYAIMGTAERVG